VGRREESREAQEQKHRSRSKGAEAKQQKQSSRSIAITRQLFSPHLLAWRRAARGQADKTRRGTKEREQGLGVCRWVPPDPQPFDAPRAQLAYHPSVLPPRPAAPRYPPTAQHRRPAVSASMRLAAEAMAGLLHAAKRAQVLALAPQLPFLHSLFSCASLMPATPLFFNGCTTRCGSEAKAA